MSHTELTDEPCPECGASLDLTVTSPEPTQPTDVQQPEHRKTIELARVKVCPECGWQQRQ